MLSQVSEMLKSISRINERSSSTSDDSLEVTRGRGVRHWFYRCPLLYVIFKLIDSKTAAELGQSLYMQVQKLGVH